MKNFISVFFLIAWTTHLFGQGQCTKQKFSYDNAGNRIQRYTVSCLVNGGDETSALKATTSVSNGATITKSPLTTFNAYPNPNKGVFQVQIENPQENGVLDLYDFMGRKMYSQNGTTTNVPINVPNLVTGTYMLVYRTPEKIVGKLKFVIE